MIAPTPLVSFLVVAVLNSANKCCCSCCRPPQRAQDLKDTAKKRRAAAMPTIVRAAALKATKVTRVSPQAASTPGWEVPGARRCLTSPGFLPQAVTPRGRPTSRRRHGCPALVCSFPALARQLDLGGDPLKFTTALQAEGAHCRRHGESLVYLHGTVHSQRLEVNSPVQEYFDGDSGSQVCGVSFDHILTTTRTTTRCRKCAQ